ncbi:MAG: DNA pilot protein [Microvirus sp.]|nr:MAG: DNA pilot protein [Microvirus sp.]
MVWPAIIAAAAQIGGGLMSRNSNRHDAFMAQRFEEQMSNTSHQREVQDLKLAGLNPVLSGTGGMGASTAKGAMPGPTENFLGEAANSGLNAWMKQAERKKVEAQVTTEEALAKRTAHEASQAEKTDKMLGLKLPWMKLNNEYENRTLEGNMKYALSKGALAESEAFDTEDYRSSLKEERLKPGSERARIQAETNLRVLEREIRSLEMPGAKNEARYQENFGYADRVASAISEKIGDVVGSARHLKDLKGMFNKAR